MAISQFQVFSDIPKIITSVHDLYENWTALVVARIMYACSSAAKAATVTLCNRLRSRLIRTLFHLLTTMISIHWAQEHSHFPLAREMHIGAIAGMPKLRFTARSFVPHSHNGRFSEAGHGLHTAEKE